MFAAVYVWVEVSDDDEELSAIASQCGYDFTHPLVLDVDEPVLAEFHGEPCLLLRLTLDKQVSGAELEELLITAKLTLSHPSISASRLLAIEPVA
jgi:hypothetical protein